MDTTGEGEGGTNRESSIDIYTACILSHFSHVQLFATPWTAACQSPLTMGFPREENWSGLPCPPPGDLPDLRDQTRVSCTAGRSLTTEPPGKPHIHATICKIDS